MYNFKVRLLQFFFGIFSLFRSKSKVTMENVLLRQQLIALKLKNPRPRLSRFDRLFWVMIRMAWKKWKDSLVFVKPETVVRWHRKLFKSFWKRKSRGISSIEKGLLKKELRRMISRMAAENASWGAPRIHGELLKLGFNISERTVSRYMPKREPSREKSQKWLTFMHNHRTAIAAMDFFIVPTLFFRQLYCFIIIGHGKRKIIHVGVTFHPTSEWIKKRLNGLFSGSHDLKYMVYDNDSIFSRSVTQTLKSLGIETIRTAYRSPWQNGIAERFIGSCRRELLAYVIVLNKRHLLTLLHEYIDYYHHDRTHCGLNKETPLARKIESRPDPDASVVSLSRLGGLHHRYTWKKAA